MYAIGYEVNACGFTLYSDWADYSFMDVYFERYFVQVDGVLDAN